MTYVPDEYLKFDPGYCSLCQDRPDGLDVSAYFHAITPTCSELIHVCEVCILDYEMRVDACDLFHDDKMTQPVVMPASPAEETAVAA